MQRVHFNYVDCVRWLGGHLVSKSTDDRLIVWHPGADSPAPTRECDICFVQVGALAALVASNLILHKFCVAFQVSPMEPVTLSLFPALPLSRPSLPPSPSPSPSLTLHLPPPPAPCPLPCPGPQPCPHH